MSQLTHSPKFGVSISTNDAFAARKSRSRVDIGLNSPNQAAKAHDIPMYQDTSESADRDDVALQMNLRYMELRSAINSSRSMLRKLRAEYSDKRNDLQGVLEESQQSDVNRVRLQSLLDVLERFNSLASPIHRLEGARKFNIVKKSVSSISSWNGHVSAMLTFLEAQQHSILTSHVTPKAQQRRVSKTSGRHWSP